ncbi:G-protein coupled receptor 183-like [Dasypus novemcinctus]|uniref:G-protein coupled receptor 183-like n=1 Tax=Dasypus novemcinctus TaxID=9361 RepID=UPI000328A743|nr:G-protein coupled receptor 183-like [Dasypus novemcinctus]
MASGVTDPSSFLHNASLCLPHHLPRAASVALSLFYTVLLVFSALGNVLALCLACQKDKKSNSTDVYLAHLAASDLLFTLALPGKITYYALDFSWPFGDGLCRLTAFVFFVNTYGGLYLMTCVSVDRYLAVVGGPRRPPARSARRARLACAAVWALASLQTMPLLLRRAFQLSLQVTVSVMNVSCCIDPIIYFFASKGYRKWLLSILQSRLGASSSSPGKASSETPSVSQTVGNMPLAENRV